MKTASLLAGLQFENVSSSWAWLWVVLTIAGAAILVATYWGIFQRSERRLTWVLMLLRGLALVALLLARALTMVHPRGRGWVNKHVRVVAGRARPPSADVERRPGATSVSVGLEPHLDHRGNQQYEEVAR